MMILLAACLLAALDTAAWLGMQHALSRTLDRAAAAGTDTGWQLATTSPTRGGWPFSATLTVANLRFAGHGMAWSGERITVSRALWRPRRITVLAGGAQMFQWTGLVRNGVAAAAPAGIATSFRIRARRIAVHLPVSWRDGRVISFDGDAVRITPPAAGPGLALNVAKLHGRLRWTSQATALSLAMDNAAWADGSEIPSARLQASLIERPARLLLSDAELRWPDARIALSGDAWFTQAGSGQPGSGQPFGRFSARVVGADALLNREVAAGGLTPAGASAIRAVLGLIAQAGGNQADDSQAAGQPGAAEGMRIAISPLQLPLGLHDGWLWLGSIPLWQLGWPPTALP